MDIIWDLGTILCLIFMIMLIACSISFFFIKINDLIGLKVEASVLSEEIWHKVHVVAGIANIPFIVGYFILIFVKSVIIKLMLSMVLIMAVIIVWSIIPQIVTRKIRKEKRQRERKELEQKRKEESGWL